MMATSTSLKQFPKKENQFVQRQNNLSKLDKKAKNRAVSNNTRTEIEKMHHKKKDTF